MKSIQIEDTIQTIAGASQKSDQSLPVALPVARTVNQGPGEVYVARDPAWTAFRWWHADVHYQSRPRSGTYQIELALEDGTSRQLQVPRSVWEKFREVTAVVQRFIRELERAGKPEGSPVEQSLPPLTDIDADSIVDSSDEPCHRSSIAA